MKRTASFGIVAVTAVLTASSLLTSCSEPLPEKADGLSAGTSDAVNACEDDGLLTCAKASTIGEFVPDTPTKATGEPIHLGMINQENTAAGSYPELSGAVQAGADFINNELGGVNGRPIEIEVCNTEFSAEGSTSCGQKFVEEEVPAVLGGIDVFGNGIDTLGDNGIPFVGGIPVSFQSVQAANSFQWSGGTWGATVAFSWYAAEELKAKKVSILYGDFGSITDSAEMGKQVLEGYGVDVQLVPYPILATDISSALNAAAASKPDAMFVLAADSGCKAGFDGAASMGIDATMFYVGACASPTIIDQAGAEKTDGAMFNVEGPIGATPPDPDFTLYSAVIHKYGKGMDPIGAGTVSFRSFMNLFVVLSELDGDITPQAITDAFRAKVDAPSFSGHDYTCDGKQFPGFPAMCSPQQVLGQMKDEQLSQVGDWIDVGQIGGKPLSTYLGYLFAGLGGGAVVASLALGLVLTHRSSGVINFAHAAMGMYVAFTYFEFRETGDWVIPVIGLPDRVHLLARPTLASALAFAAIVGTVLGLLVYGLVFRPLRQAPPLARVVASLGLLLYLQEVVRLRFPVAGASAVRHRPVLTEDPVAIFGTTVTANRLILAGLVVAISALLGAIFHFTRIGLATRAAAGNEKGALLLGISPDRLASTWWAVASVLAGMAVILIEPIAGLSPTTTTLLVIPALAAALLGGLESFAITTAAGLAIGMIQSLILGWSVRPDTNWIPAWLPTTGLQQIVPAVVIIGVLIWRGDALPDRAAIAGRRLPPSPEPRHVTAWTVVLVGLASVGLVTFGSGYRHALIISMVFALLTLSVVVLTGFSGQISLAQLAFAGVAGFASIRLAEHHVPFPIALVLASLLATVLGVLVGWPATRVRGMSLAIATLAMAVAIEELVLASPSFSHGHAGSSAPRPYVGWIDVGSGATGHHNFRPVFGFVCLVILTLASLAVVNLRRNRTGLRWLAVRANERAAAAAGIDVTRAKLGAFAVSSFLAGLCGVLMAFSVSTLSPTSFLVIGSLVAVALTYLAGVSSVGGALVAGALAQAGIYTAFINGITGGDANTYVFAISGIALIVTAIAAPEGITGVVRWVFDGHRRKAAES